MTSSPGLRKDVSLILLDIALAVLAVLLLNHYNIQLSKSDDLIVGMLVCGLFILLEIFWLVSRMDEGERAAEQLWLIEHPFEQTLHNIRVHYKTMAERFYGDHDLFKDYFDRRLAETEEVIQAAAIHHELEVKDYHFRNTDLVLDAFRGDDTQLLRYVWIIGPGEDLFDEKWQHYCSQIEEAAKSGEIKEVRALLVLKTTLTKEHPIVKTLAGYYEFSNGFAYRLIDETRYQLQKIDNRLEAEYIDFGIYGQRYIYLTKSYGSVIAGKWCKDAEDIKRYTDFFDIVWNSRSASKLARNSVSPATLLELFNLKW